ncbi:histidine kinase [Micromonospora sp. NPDC049559]|uniref:sensor histidine kinase n=1 Tax=Micromonospora sp. NPDC049559 TaxID=3155923 RepID=UPI00341C20D1
MDPRDWLGRRLGDLGLAGLTGAALALQAVAIAQSWGAGYWPFDCAAGAATCAAALLRRRHRSGAALAGLALAAVAVLVAGTAALPAEPSPAMALNLSVLVGSAVRALPVPWASGIAGGGLAVVAGTWLAFPVDGGSRAVTSWNAAAWLAALAAGLGLRLLDARRRAVAERVRRDERLNLARELHDVVAHHITGIVLQAQAAQLAAGGRSWDDVPAGGDVPPENGAPDVPPGNSAPDVPPGSGVPDVPPGNSAPDVPSGIDVLVGIERAGSDALAAMRRVVSLLRDADDAPPATAAPERIGELVERFAAHHGRPHDDPHDRPHGRLRGGPHGGPSVRLRMPDDEPEWPPEVTNTVYRVVQESLTNVARHAPQARAVTVDVTREGSALTVEVADDGPPVRARADHLGGYGLVGMRERVEALGGTLRAGPRAGAGWCVRATLPVPAREAR